jgi:hypothetical protein
MDFLRSTEFILLIFEIDHVAQIDLGLRLTLPIETEANEISARKG